jgi:hypothetical protein
MSWGDEIYAEAIAGRIPAGAKLRKGASAQIVEAAPAQIIKQSRKGLNKTETRFKTQYLEPRVAMGEIDEIGEHESITLRLANGLRLSPDFPTWTEGRLTFYEVKGAFIREDARDKLKMAATKYKHIRFFLFQYIKGEWFRQEVLP